MIPVSEEQTTQPDLTTSIELRYPTLPLNRSLASWLDRSQILTMGSTADDSSIDENMSSIEDSVWDIIDEASVATSDDEDRNLSRQPTPSSDGHDQDIEGDPEDADIDHESPRMALSHGRLAMDDSVHEGSTEAVEESWNSEVTNFGLDHGVEVKAKNQESNTFLQGQGSIKFYEPQNKDIDALEHVDVVHEIKEFKGKDYDELGRYLRSVTAPSRIIGTFRQRMSRQTLRLNGPYKLLYIGSPSAKQAVVQKISAALASSLDTSSTMATSPASRFSIIPISAFGSDSSPEVVLIDHIGLEIYVEEGTSASYTKENDGKDTISLDLDNGRFKIDSFWHNKSFAVSNNYKLPNLAVICIPEDEDTVAKQTRLLARSFISRHGIPAIIISTEVGWNKSAQAMTLDHRTPHCCVEAYGPQAGNSRVLKRLPIDLSSFLDIDAVQMNRNLACVSQDNSETGRDTVKQSQLGEVSLNRLGSGTNKGWLESLRFQISPAAWSTAKLAKLLIYGALFSIVMLSLDGSKFASLSGKTAKEVLTSPSLSKLPDTIIPVTSSPLSTAVGSNQNLRVLEKSESSRTKSLSAHTSTDVAALLESYSLTPNKSDKFQIQIVGDCHVVLRPPQWFTVLRKSPALLFKVTRQGETLDYSFSTLFDGVHALQLRKEDAYGTVNVSVWTIKKPRVNETLQADFGTPWLRVAGWKKASQVATEQVREELQSAQTGLTSVYEQTTTSIQMLMKQAVSKADCALKEVEKAGLTSLNQTMRTTEIMVAQSKALSRTLSQQLQQQGSRATSHLIAQQERVHRDITGLSRKMSDLLSWQSQILSNAASRLNVISLAHEVQEYRETHLIESQKQAIRMWWTLRGGPPPRKPALKKRHKSNGVGST